MRTGSDRRNDRTGRSSEVMGWPEPAEQETDLMGGADRGPAQDRSDLMGEPEPARRDTDVMGVPEPSPQDTDVMGEPEPAPRDTDVMGQGKEDRPDPG